MLPLARCRPHSAQACAPTLPQAPAFGAYASGVSPAPRQGGRREESLGGLVGSAGKMARPAGATSVLPAGPQ